MLRPGQTIAAGNVALHAILALAFLMLTAVQPGMAAKGPAAVSQAAHAARHHANAPGHAASRVHDQHSRGHVHEKQTENAVAADHGHAGKGSSDYCCDVHCAPADAVAVGFQQLMRGATHGFAPLPAAILVDGRFAELTRPPKHLR